MAPSWPPGHPDPPATFARITLPLRPLGDLRTEWPRLYDNDFPSSLHWGRAVRYRFDDPEGEYGVLYAGQDACCAFIETFGDSRGPHGQLELAEADLNARSLAVITVPLSLQIVDLTGEGLANIGADARLTAGDDYANARRWSRAIWDHDSEPDGIYYRARHDPQRVSLALFNRPTMTAVTEELRGPLSDQRNVADMIAIFRTYTVSLL